MLEISFHQSETVEEAEIERKDLVFIYRNRGEAWFHEVGNPGARFSMPEDAVADKLQWIKEKDEVIALEWNDELIGLEIPIKTELVVKDGTAPQ